MQMAQPLALIVEDEERLADIFSVALQRAEFEVKVVHDGNEALTQLATTVPAVVILDLYLPGILGDEVLRAIRADERLAETRVVVITADWSMAKQLRVRSDFILVKPVSVSQLCELGRFFRPPNPWLNGVT